MQTHTIITYGTFDLFHIGHLQILKRLKEMGDRLVVGVSTDDFNKEKGKKTIIPFSDRLEIIKSIKYVDEAFAEENWNQKVSDIKKYNAQTFAMGSDWTGKFDHLKAHCTVLYLPRTDGISSTEIKKSLQLLSTAHIQDLKQALDLISSIVNSLE
jgi:glycerol-3-phosphate cytidylyltransferase